MVLRAVVDGPGTGKAYLTLHSGAGSVVPALIGEILERYRDDGEAALDAYEVTHPATVARLRAARWLSRDVVVRHVPASPHLKRLQIEVLLTCNLRCSYCYSTSGPGRRERLTREEVLDAVAQADLLGVHQIDFTGGELMMDRAWQEYVTAARGLGMAVTVHTNGTLVTADSARFLAEAGVSFVQVSVDSHDPDTHNASRGHRTALQRTLRGLAHLRTAGVPTRISIMVHQGNVATIGTSIDYFARQFPGFTVNIDRVIASTPEAAEVGLTNEQFWEVVRPYTGGAVQVAKVCESAGALADHEPDCGVAYSYIYLTGEGEIAACPTMTSRESETFTGPDFRTTSLRDAWYDSAFFTGFRYTNCENVLGCPSGSACGGGCRSNAYTDQGYVGAPDVIACNTNKNPGQAFVDFAGLYSRLRATG